MLLLVVLAGVLVIGAVAFYLLSQQPAEGGGDGPGPSQSTGGGGAVPDATSFGPVPAWARKGDNSPAQEGSMGEMRRVLQAMNASGRQIDFLLYGDSITAFHRMQPATFNKHFGDLHAAALGVGGHTIEQLAWRITGGNERPAKPPKVIALLIGVNNTRGGDFAVHAQRLEELVQWLQRAYPPTRLVLMALLPANRGAGDLQRANRLLRDIARRRSVTFAECGQQLDPADTRLYSDGLHPTAAGHDVVLACLRRIVGPALR